MIRRAILVMVLTSVVACSNDDSGSEIKIKPEPKLKIKRIVEERYSDSKIDTISADFNYYGDEFEDNKGKLSNIAIDPEKKHAIVFSYKVDKIDNFLELVDLRVLKNNLVTYDGDKIKSITTILSEGGNIKKEYFYEDDGVLKAIQVFKNDSAMEEPDIWEYTFDEKNNVIALLLPDGEAVRKKKNIQFDDKKNPLSDMSPYVKYALPYFESFDVFTKNNILKQEWFRNPDDTEPYRVISFKMQYNPEGYPTEIRKVNDVNQALLSKMTITYTESQTN